MAKPPEISDRIKALRTERGESQLQFASVLGMRQATISDWESATTDTVPSAESYVQLGNLAPYPDSLWFWQQAGIDQSVMLSAAGKLLKERGELAENKCVAVPPLRTEAAGKGAAFEFVDAKYVPNPGSVAYCVIERATCREAGLIPGDVVILDTSSNNSPSLRPFWESEVLVEVTEEVKQLRTARPRPGLHAGRLRLHTPSGGRSPHEHWLAVLFPPRHVLEPRGYGEILGMWNISMTADSYRLRGADRQFDPELLRARVEEELRLYAGCTILGRVIYVIRPPSSKSRAK